MLDKFDKLDKAILNLIQLDISLSSSEIAERVGLSQPPCWRRIKKLEKLGVIKSRVALLDPKKIGLNVTVFARVKLSAHGRQSLPEFEQQIQNFPEVLECYTMMGEYDFLLKIITKDIDTYESFFRHHLSQMPTVQEISSNAALSKIKDTTVLPLSFSSPSKK